MILMCKVSKNFANGHYEIEDFNNVERNLSKDKYMIEQNPDTS